MSEDRAPLSFADIRGQTPALDLLRCMLAVDRIPHALLFSGIEGVGKKTAARTFAMACNCRARETSGIGLEDGREAPCGRCRPCRKILAATHPDFLVLEPVGAFIRIGQVRELLATLAMKPYEGRVRVVVVVDAHRLNPAAGNALLKILEEPPPRTVLILTAPQSGDLLSTIVSRCQHIRFTPLPPATIAELLMERCGRSEDEARIMAAMGAGSFGRAAAMNSGWLARRRWLLEELAVLADRPVHVLLALAGRLAAEREQLPATFEVLKSWLRDLAIRPFAPDEIVNIDLTHTIQCGSRKEGTADIAAKFDAVLEAERSIAANANPRLTLEALLLRLAAAP